MRLLGIPVLCSLGLALSVGCGIDLADGTERVNMEDLEGAAKGQPKECSDSLKAIKTAAVKRSNNYNLGFSETSFLPDDAPSKAKRKWNKKEKSAFDTIGWKPSGQIQGSYKLKATSSSSFKATCITDVDEDGAYATWTVTDRAEPTLVTGEGVR